jgi:2-polyprenyl-3-methyl-5-hydroxy-6-metoxy-1,4-benzoquinol methylase
MQVRFPVPKVEITPGRHEVVLRICRGKRVLHLGCVDEGLLHARYARGELLHLKLLEVGRELWGVDISEQGIEFLASQGILNLIVADVEHINAVSELTDKEFDVIVASELIEHLANPGAFLSATMELMQNNTTMILTVPNAYRVGTLLRMLKGEEYVHPDHNYWFSFKTITTLVQKHGYSIKEIYVYASGPTRIKTCLAKTNLPLRWLRCLANTLLSAFLLKLNPFFGDGIILLLYKG